MSKKVVVIGGAGTVGQILMDGLSNKYEMVAMDKNVNRSSNMIEVDATNYDRLLSSIPKGTDVIINLIRTETNFKVEKIDQFNLMNEVFLKATYYILDAAVQLGIPKVIFASSNHVTDYYEDNGVSRLGREITVKDYPYSKGLYGVLKLASEHFGHIFSMEKNISVINIRIGSVPKDEQAKLMHDKRLEKTLLTKVDVIELFDAAIKSNVKYGTYYGVSNNPGKPWDISNAQEELGFHSKMNTQDFLQYIHR